jgi:hypothetical protein
MVDMIPRDRPRYSIVIDSNALRKYPFLDKLTKEKISSEKVNDFINAVEARPEGFKVELINQSIRVILKQVDREGNEDTLGLPRIEGQLKEICEIFRDDTRVDPRKEIYFSRKSSILNGSEFTEEALIAPNSLPVKGNRKRHPIDRVTCEEVVKRRELADRRWSSVNKKRKHQPSKQQHRDTENAKDYFGKRGT